LLVLRQDHRQVLSQRIDPKLIMANAILQQNSLELEQQIKTELLENPALDMLEDVQPCQGDCIDPANCPFCSQRLISRYEEKDAQELPDAEPEYVQETFWESEDDYDPVGNLEAEITLKDHLKTLMRAALNEEDFSIGEYLIDNLDDNGWLATDPELLAQETGENVEDVLRVLAVIQSFDPPGVGARDLQECLVIQLQFLREEGQGNPLAERMVRRQFKDVVSRRYSRLARVNGISLDKTRDTIEYIRTHLNPYPANQFRPPWIYKPSGSKSAVRPDVVIRRTEYGYEVEVQGSDPYNLAVTTTYRSVYNNIKQGSQVPEDEKKHVTEYVERAELFIRNINQRRKTLRLITKCIIECQQGFLETGSRAYVRPLTRTRVAQILELHESTVSRATANKFVQLPNQEVVSFDIFFNPSLSIKTAIEEIISGEDPTKPFSDQQIADILKEKGMDVARRTVVKYREAQKLLSSNRRRR
jgi:RNA polymerase sigma-54 factor